MEVKILGQNVAEASDWKDIDITCFQFLDPEFTELGKKFIRMDIATADYLSVNFETGNVEIGFEGEEDQVIHPDWSVFNK